MSLFRARDYDEEKLASEPETGMDFQLVRGTISGHKANRFMVIGSRLILPARTRGELLDSLQKLTESEATDLDEVPAKRTGFESPPQVIFSMLDGQVREAESGVEVPGTERPERLIRPQGIVATRTNVPPMAYFRFSANQKDPRVLPNGDFVSGTYATTYNDLGMVPSGFAAVGRYALPSPLSARYMFIIMTNSSPQLIGTAVPNFGQAGGGVEVLFRGGATAMTGVPHEIAYG